ncbi:hypothetical protein B0H11DRAFT_2037469 [Mycena galericulata]|nr:hypothetical protein B0H11DRAFT_2037469 [Mycena galericulata]
MLQLPIELVDTIFSLLDKQDLFILVQVSSRFQRVALWPLLSRYHVSMADIASGTITIPGEACPLLRLIYSIHPIQSLTIRPPLLLSRTFSALISALAVTPPIPNILVDSRYLDRHGIAKLIITSSRSHSDTIVFIGRDNIGVSLPRPAPPIRWKWILPRPELTLSNIFFVFTLFIFLAPMYLISGLANGGVLLVWLYRRFFGPQWDQHARIAADLVQFDGGSVRLQIVPVPGAGRLTLVTFGGITPVRLSVPCIPALSFVQYSTVLAHIHLEEHLAELTIQADCALVLTDLMHFVHRHSKLRALVLRRRAVDHTSLKELPVSGATGSISSLSAPAVYIPYILPLAPRVRLLSVRLGEKSDHPGHPLHRHSYTRVIDTIATLPAPAVEALVLYISPTLISAALPWHIEPGDEARLASVTYMTLVLQGNREVRPADIQQLPRWLARFPALVRVEFVGRAVGQGERAALDQAIAAERARSHKSAAPWLGVHFS